MTPCDLKNDVLNKQKLRKISDILLAQQAEFETRTMVIRYEANYVLLSFNWIGFSAPVGFLPQGVAITNSISSNKV
jgi:hypothetical protein